MTVSPSDVEPYVPSVFPREFCLDGQYRRCGWYVVIGAVSCLVLAATLAHLGVDPPEAPGAMLRATIMSGIAIAAAIVLWTVVQRWRLRVDKTGLARRRLWRWDAWPWEEFASGEVFRERWRYRAPRRPFWRNVLDFGSVSADDRDFLHELCQRHLPPFEEPPPAALPESLTLRYQLVCALTLHRHGLRVRGLRGTLDVPWSEVREAWLVCNSRFADVLALELELPGRVVRVEGASRLIESGGSKHADESFIPRPIEQFLRAKLPTGKVLRCHREGPPQSAAEHDYRRRQAESKLRSLRRWQWTLPAMVTTLLLLGWLPGILACLERAVPWTEPAWIAIDLAIAAVSVLVPPAAYWGLLRWHIHQQGRELARLDAWQAAEADNSATRSASQ